MGYGAGGSVSAYGKWEDCPRANTDLIANGTMAGVCRVDDGIREGFG